MIKKILFLLTICSLLTGSIASAQTNQNIPENSCDNKLENKLSIQNQAKSSEKFIITERTISLTGITRPSLWWARQQFDPFGGRLINNWLAYPQVRQINLIVNWQLWTLLDYVGRYRFVNQFGTVARKYGYELHIFDQQKQCLASYQYNPESFPPKWEINLEQSDKDSLQIEPPKN